MNFLTKKLIAVALVGSIIGGSVQTVKADAMDLMRPWHNLFITTCVFGCLTAASGAVWRHHRKIVIEERRAPAPVAAPVAAKRASAPAASAASAGGAAAAAAGEALGPLAVARMVAAGAEPAVAVAPAAAPARSWFPQMTAQNIADYAKWSTLAFGLATVISGKATRFLGKIAKESMEDRRQLVESLTNIDTRLSAITRAQKVALVPIST